MTEDDLRRAKDHADSDLNWMDFDLWKHKAMFDVVDESIECPSCHYGMVALEYADTRVQVDYCERCNGVWLDAGEFEKIVEALRAELETKDFPGYVKASLKEAADLVRSEEGLVSDWKDFTTVLRMLKYRILSRAPGIVKLLADLQSRNPVQ
jgi:Zn-finger nucleic acid-binding protein